MQLLELVKRSQSKTHPSPAVQAKTMEAHLRSRKLALDLSHLEKMESQLHSHPATQTKEEELSGYPLNSCNGVQAMSALL